MAIKQKIRNMKQDVKQRASNIFHVILKILYNVIILFERICVICYILGAFCHHIRCYYFKFWKDFIGYINEGNAITTLTIILSLSVAIFSMLLSIDSNSLLLKLSNKEIKIFVDRIGISFISTIYLICVLFVNGAYDLFLINDMFLFLLIYNILILMIQLYILIYDGISKKINNIRSSKENSSRDNDRIINIVQSIYERQSPSKKRDN